MVAARPRNLPRRPAGGFQLAGALARPPIDVAGSTMASPPEVCDARAKRSRRGADAQRGGRF